MGRKEPHLKPVDAGEGEGPPLPHYCCCDIPIEGTELCSHSPPPRPRQEEQYRKVLVFSKKRKLKDVKGISFLLNNVKGFLGTVHIDPCLCAQNEPRGSAPGADRKAAAANAT